MAKKINVGGELNSTALEGKLVDALQVKDSSRGDKSQKEIIDNLESNTGISEYPEFSEAKDYAVGDVVLYEGLLKRFTSAHEPGAWDGSQVEAWSERKEVDGKITELEQKLEQKVEMKVGINLLDVTTCISNSYINANTGNVGFFDNVYVTDFIKVDGNNLYCNKPSRAGEIIGWAAYDSEKKYTHGESEMSKRGLYTYEEGDMYVRFSISTLEEVIISIGSESTEYTPFNPVGGWGIEQNSQNIVKITSDIVKSMILTEAYMVQNAQYEDGMIITPVDVLWANGKNGKIQNITRDDSGLVVELVVVVGINTFTLSIDRDESGNVINMLIN